MPEMGPTADKRIENDHLGPKRPFFSGGSLISVTLAVTRLEGGWNCRQQRKVATSQCWPARSIGCSVSDARAPARASCRVCA